MSPTPAPVSPIAPAMSVRGGSARPGHVVRLAFRVDHPDAAAIADVRLTLQTLQGKALRSQTLRNVDVTSGHTWRVHAPGHRGAYVVIGGRHPRHRTGVEEGDRHLARPLSGRNRPLDAD